MAKVVYFHSPILNEKQEFDAITIRQAMLHFKIENDPLCVGINGEIPDEIDLDAKLNDTDLVQIRRYVEGNSSSQKSGLASIIQIAGLITASFFTGGAAIAILIGSSLISGALNSRAAELNAKDLNGGDNEQPVDSNNFSLATASNKAKQQSPMPLVMGSHRMAPDIFTDAYRYYFGYDNVFGETTPVNDTFYPGITAANGPLSATGGSWVEMPVGYIQTGFPAYKIKIAPYHFRSDTSTPTPSEKTAILDAVKAEYTPGGGGTSLIRYWKFGSEVSPLVIYHSDASDPMHGRYSLMHLLCRQVESGLGYHSFSPPRTNINNLFDNDSTNTLDWFDKDAPYGAGSGNDYASLKLYPASSNWYPSTVGGAESAATLLTKINTFLVSTLNNGTITSGNKTNSFAIQKRFITTGTTSVNKTGIKASEQVFCYGLGDLDISDRKLGGFNADDGLDLISPTTETPVTVGRIEKTDSGLIEQWQIPGQIRGLLNCDSVVLSNENKTDTNIPVTNTDPENWVVLRGKPGLESFNLFFSGQVYAFSGTSFATNSSRYQVQLKRNTESTWNEVEDSFGASGSTFLVIENNNSKKFVQRYTYTWPLLTQDEYLMARIRKVTKNANDNSTAKVSNIGVEFAAFFKYNDFISGDPAYPTFTNNAPLNLENVRVTENVSSSVSQFIYSALVEAKCWVYDEVLDTWSWTKTRNPAWWFLYFAYGGFLNLDSDTSYSYPYSPTWGWVNYPGHPDSTEHIFGAGLTNDEIDLDKIKEWAIFCDDNNLNFDFILTEDMSVSDCLERIANGGRGSCTYYKGKLSVVYEDTDQVPTCMFGMGNIISGSFSVDYSVSDPVGKVICKYVDRDQSWETKEVESAVPFASSDNVKSQEITLSGVTESARAQREVNILAARQYYQRRSYTWKVDFEGLIARRGDLVYLSHDSTQYGFSGRVMKFNTTAGLITSIDVGSELDSSILYVTIREPNGSMATYPCTVSGQRITFGAAYPLAKAPYYISPTESNTSSAYLNSVPEDFVFIAGSKATPGKIVRISEIISEDDLTFTIKAVDEDPAMWSYEFGPPIDNESFDDSELVLEVLSAGFTLLGNGLVKVNWNMTTGDYVQIINKETGLPIQENGSYSFTGNEVTLELVAGQKYTLEIKPFAVGTPYKSVSKEITFWQT
jgi:hypothetical protein